MKRLLIGSIAALLLSGTLAPAALATRQTTGSALGLFDTTYPADTPFHIVHGFLGYADAPLVHPGWYRFALEIDGLTQDPTFVTNDPAVVAGAPEEVTQVRLFVYDFPTGLSIGTYTFTYHWYSACGTLTTAELADLGLTECAGPGIPVEILTMTAEVTFTGG